MEMEDNRNKTLYETSVDVQPNVYSRIFPRKLLCMLPVSELWPVNLAPPDPDAPENSVEL